MEKVIKTFGVNAKAFQQGILVNYWLIDALRMAVENEKPFRAMLEYNPKWRQMVTTVIKEISEDEHTDELRKFLELKEDKNE